MSTTTVYQSIVRWAPPGVPNAIDSTVRVDLTSNGQSCGAHDVPDRTALGTEYVIPFGGVASAKFLRIYNGCSSDIQISLLDSGGAVFSFHLGAGGYLTLALATAGIIGPVAYAGAKLNAGQVGAGYIGYWVMGD